MPEVVLDLPTVTATTERLLAALRRCHDDLAIRVRSLDEAALGRRSYCIEWSVAQVLSHLGSGAEIALAQLRAARAGTTPLGPDGFRVIWGGLGCPLATPARHRVRQGRPAPARRGRCPR
jgi:hypothetical protein